MFISRFAGWFRADTFSYYRCLLVLRVWLASERTAGYGPDCVFIACRFQFCYTDRLAAWVLLPAWPLGLPPTFIPPCRLAAHRLILPAIPAFTRRPYPFALPYHRFNANPFTAHHPHYGPGSRHVVAVPLYRYCTFSLCDVRGLRGTTRYFLLLPPVRGSVNYTTTDIFSTHHASTGRLDGTCPAAARRGGWRREPFANVLRRTTTCV